MNGLGKVEEDMFTDGASPSQSQNFDPTTHSLFRRLWALIDKFQRLLDQDFAGLFA